MDDDRVLSERVLADAIKHAMLDVIAADEGHKGDTHSQAAHAAQAVMALVEADRLALTEQIKALGVREAREIGGTQPVAFVERSAVLALVEGLAPTSEQPDA